MNNLAIVIALVIIVVIVCLAIIAIAYLVGFGLNMAFGAKVVTGQFGEQLELHCLVYNDGRLAVIDVASLGDKSCFKTISWFLWKGYIIQGTPSDNAAYEHGVYMVR